MTEDTPKSGVIFDNNGNLFGTTFGGGQGFGTIFELTYFSGVGWIESLLYRFQDGDDGLDPTGLVFDASRTKLFGTTNDGGSGAGGTVFELSRFGDFWIYKLLYSFKGPSNEDCGPVAPLTIDAAGNLYGTTNCDGAHQVGNIFKLTKTGEDWVYTSLYDFTGGNDGAYPISNVTFDENGNLYGTASEGGRTNMALSG